MDDWLDDNLITTTIEGDEVSTLSDVERMLELYREAFKDRLLSISQELYVRGELTGRGWLEFQDKVKEL